MEPRILDGRYRLEDLLGEGGFGVVYRARQLTTDQPVAIKELRLRDNLTASRRDELQARFTREMELIAALHHPHIVRLLDARLDAEPPYMVLELVHGRPLDELLKAGPLPEPMTRRLFAQLLEAMAEAHDRGIVHRDLKPHNIMVLGEGEQANAKILDFGIAGVVRGAEGLSHHTITEVGQIRGTPRYMAPEQFELFKTPRAESDVYALGLILAECYTGAPLASGTSMEALYHQHSNGLSLPEALDASPLGPLLRRACAVDPARRFSSARALLHAFAALPHNEGALPALEQPPPPTGTAPTRPISPRALTPLGDDTIPNADFVAPAPAPPPAATPPPPEEEPPALLPAAPQPRPSRRGPLWFALGAAALLGLGWTAARLSVVTRPVPPPCKIDQDCEESCPDNFASCVCRPDPHRVKRCLPACQTDSDCPSEDGLRCNAEGFCAPDQ